MKQIKELANMLSAPQTDTPQDNNTSKVNNSQPIANNTNNDNPLEGLDLAALLSGLSANMDSNNNNNNNNTTENNSSNNDNPLAGLDLGALLSGLSSNSNNNNVTDNNNNTNSGNIDFGSILSSLGGLTGGGGNTNNSQSPQSSDGLGGLGIDFSTIMKLQGIMQTVKHDENAELLIALKPLLSESRREKVDKAVKMLKLWNIYTIAKEQGLLNLSGLL